MRVVFRLLIPPDLQPFLSDLFSPHPLQCTAMVPASRMVVWYGTDLETALPLPK